MGRGEIGFEPRSIPLQNPGFGSPSMRKAWAVKIIRDQHDNGCDGRKIRMQIPGWRIPKRTAPMGWSGPEKATANWLWNLAQLGGVIENRRALDLRGWGDHALQIEPLQFPVMGHEIRVQIAAGHFSDAER